MIGTFLLASVLAPVLSGGLMTEVSIVGGFLIFASGLSILKIKEISAMNLLPALLVPRYGSPSSPSPAASGACCVLTQK